MSTLVGMSLTAATAWTPRSAPAGCRRSTGRSTPSLERQVAIKLMHRDIARDPDQLERFRREARAVAQLNHPHIVGVIDAGEEEGRAVHRLRVRRGRDAQGRASAASAGCRIEEAIAYAIEIARALGAAHERGIVHRDVKPQNVLVDEEGSAKVTDFGIARTLDEDGLTADGRVLGTTDYVSPEQALGHDVNGQSDLYSLGVVLYEMLTGDVPFHGENQVAVAMKHVREELPDVQTRRPEVSAALAAIVDRMTDKDLARRYPRRGELDRRPRGRARGRDRALRPGDRRGDRRSCARCPSPPGGGCPLRMRWRVPLVALLLVVAVGAVAAGFLVKRRATTPSAAPASARVRARAQHPQSCPSATPRRRTTTRAATTASTRARRRSPSTATRRRRGTPRPTGPATCRRTGVGLYVDAKPSTAARSDRDRDPDGGLAGRDLRRRRGARSPDEPRRLDARGRRDRHAARAALRARHGRPALPLLPGLDHEAPAGRAAGRDRRGRASSLRSRAPVAPAGRYAEACLRALGARSARRARPSSRSHERRGTATPDASQSFGVDARLR